MSIEKIALEYINSETIVANAGISKKRMKKLKGDAKREYLKKQYDSLYSKYAKERYIMNKIQEELAEITSEYNKRIDKLNKELEGYNSKLGKKISEHQKEIDSLKKQMIRFRDEIDRIEDIAIEQEIEEEDNFDFDTEGSNTNTEVSEEETPTGNPQWYL